MKETSQRATRVKYDRKEKKKNRRRYMVNSVKHPFVWKTHIINENDYKIVREVLDFN